MATSQHLSRLALEAEDVASALRTLRDQHEGTSSITVITEAVSRLFGLSTTLRRLAQAHDDSRYRNSLYRIRDDVQLVYCSACYTLEVALHMGRRPVGAQWMVWGDMDHRMREMEGAGLLERLNWYRIFAEDLLDQLDGRTSDGLLRSRDRVQSLLRLQDNARLLGQTRQFIESGKTKGDLGTCCARCLTMEVH